MAVELGEGYGISTAVMKDESDRCSCSLTMRISKLEEVKSNHFDIALLCPHRCSVSV